MRCLGDNGGGGCFSRKRRQRKDEVDKSAHAGRSKFFGARLLLSNDKRPKKSYLPVFAKSCSRGASLLPAGGLGLPVLGFLRHQIPELNISPFILFKFLFLFIAGLEDAPHPPHATTHTQPTLTPFASHTLAETPSSHLLPVPSL